MGIKDIFGNKKELKPRVLIESKSPNCNIQAVAEEDNRCVYFYLFGQPEYQEKYMNACWVRNYEKAPSESDVSAMRAGKAPMLPADYCSHPGGAEKLEPSQLKIVWFEEGNGAALLSNNEILCVIPSWASAECPGYSRDCIRESEFAWPLGSPSENVLFERINKAKEFWDSWGEHSWGKIQETHLAEIEKSLGKYDKYYAIDDGHWPPKAMITIEKGNLTVVLTLGVAVIPQPNVEMFCEEPAKYRRFEFGFVIETELLNQNRNGILSYISGQTSLPWSCLTWLGHGHTLPCEQIWPDNSEFSFMLLVSGNYEGETLNIDYPAFREDPVNILWMVPITSVEQKFAEEHGSELMIRERSKDGDDLRVFRGQSKFNI